MKIRLVQQAASMAKPGDVYLILRTLLNPSLIALASKASGGAAPPGPQFVDIPAIMEYWDETEQDWVIVPIVMPE
jgi:hypothetical protein